MFSKVLSRFWAIGMTLSSHVESFLEIGLNGCMICWIHGLQTFDKP